MLQINMLLKYYSVVVLCLSVVNGEPEEPKCFSRFDYDEKMLMKLLRFEDKVQKFEDFINGVKAREVNEKEERDELFAAELQKVEEFNNGAKVREVKEKEERDKIFAAELEKVKEFNNGAKAREAKEKEERDKLFAAELEKVKKFNNEAKALEAKEKEARNKLFAAELEKVKNFQRLINEVKTRGEKEIEERSKLFLAELKKYKQVNAKEVERQKNVTSEMLESVANSKMEFENVHKQINERVKGKVVAFTGTAPKMGTTSRSMSFTTVITNVGNAFDT
ncbi:calponin homology domain-containing protein DDB_G0272472-like [Ruditapes philippinarum]|uniref:calponin homology domain-containing protein DDB_G0272472-like n=1 Tax=Ruditapes philippinarum TaxID=129788 RepID=UPI00295BB4D4|nr:calponin homology domain-containing protein DDB_G0272472-like [Ruditapes philippinarum]